MNLELPTIETPKKEQAAVDEKWYKNLEAIKLPDILEQLNEKKEDAEKQKNLFESEKIRNPEFKYPKLEKLNLDQYEKSLLGLKKEIIENEANEAIKLMYCWSLNERIARIRMLKATKEGNDARFFRYSRFIHGMPDEDIFRYSMEKINEEILLKKDSDDLRVRFAINRLKDSLPWLEEKSNVPRQSFEKKSLIIDPNKDQRKYDATAISEIFQWFLENRNLHEWKVIIEKEGAKKGVSVSQSKKHILIPEKSQMRIDALHKLIEHEIGTHAVRGHNGGRSKLKLLGLGLDRYIKGEEGIATYAEQKAVGADDYSGFDGHLAVALAVGSDGIKRDFRSVYNVLRDYYFVKSSGVDLDKAWKSARNSAWIRSLRTFRGTSGSTAGACMTKDIAYREGNIATWGIISENPSEEKLFSLGKYDPANPRHLWILEQLGISDEDLETLDK